MGFRDEDLSGDIIDYEDNFNNTEVHIKELSIVPKLDRVVHRRRKKLHVSGEALAYIDRSMNGRHLGVSELANEVPNLMRVGRETYNEVSVPEGWNITKGVFTMVVEETTPQYVRTCYYVGYTDRYDVSYGGLFDDRATFYINKVYVVNELKSNIRKGLSPGAPILFSLVDGRFDVEEDLYLARPEDLAVNSISSEISPEADVVDNPTNVITSCMVSRDSREQVGNRGAGKIINSMIGTRRANNSRMHRDATGTMTDVYNKLTFTSIAILEFLMRLSTRDRGINGVTSSFTLDDINHVFNNPSFDVYVEKDVARVIDGDMNRDTADINSGDIYTTTANEVLYSLPSLAAEALLTSVQFMIDNKNGNIYSRVLDATSVIRGVNAIPLAEDMVDKFIAEVWPVISERNLRIVDMVVSFGASHEGSKVELALDGEERFVPFYLPTYMDALISPDIHDKRSFMGEQRAFGALQEKILGVGKYDI